LLFSGFNVKSSGLLTFSDNIEIYFSHQQNFDDLVKIKNDLRQKEVTLNYQMLQFDDKGKLKEIEFKVISEGIYRGSGSSRVLKDDSKFGFIIDKSPDAEVYFRVGNL
jgi:hypothetical protein